MRQAWSLTTFMLRRSGVFLSSASPFQLQKAVGTQSVPSFTKA